MTLDQIMENQLNNLTQLLPFNWSLTDPSLFSSADEYQKLLLNCQDSGTVIHALTGMDVLFAIFLFMILRNYKCMYIRLSLIVSPRSGEMRFSRFSLVWQYLCKFGSHFKNL